MKNLLTGFLTFAIALGAIAEVPSLINYQGVLKRDNGTVILGNRNFTVRIFDAETKGKQLYQENIGAVQFDDSGRYSFGFGANGESKIPVREVVAVADGEKQVFNYTTKLNPIVGDVKVSGGGYSWTEKGSSDISKFTATLNRTTGSISAIFISGAPPTGTEVSVQYYNRGITDALMAGSQTWLELTVEGVTLSPRERLVAVPYALRAAVAGKLVNQPDSLLYHGSYPSQLPYSSDVKDARLMHILIPKGTKALRLKMLFYGGYDGFKLPTCRLKIDDKDGPWGLSGHAEQDELIINIDGVSGWKNLILQVKDFPSSSGTPQIEHLMVYTKNN
jgi:hypothetical protein